VCLTQYRYFRYRIDLDKQHIEYDLFFPVLNIRCQYKVSGRVMILPITGSGDAVLTLSELAESGGRCHYQRHPNTLHNMPYNKTIQLIFREGHEKQYGGPVAYTHICSPHMKICIDVHVSYTFSVLATGPNGRGFKPGPSDGFPSDGK
jgi:hypothetical protein